MTTLRPCLDQVLLRREPRTVLSAGGIVLPQPGNPTRGTVIATGPGGWSKRGQRRPPSVAPGDRVTFGEFAGVEVTVDGETFLLLREAEITGVLED